MYSVYFDVFSMQMMELIDVEMHEAFPVRAQPFLNTSKQGRHHYKDLNGIQHFKKKNGCGDGG
jgi:hypothetical protein